VPETKIWYSTEFTYSPYPSNSTILEHNRNCTSAAALFLGSGETTNYLEHQICSG